VSEFLIRKYIQLNQIPVHAQFAVTYRCNARCIHCYYGDFLRKTSEFSLSEIMCLLKRLAKEGTLDIGFTGGEPFLRKDFLDIARYARKLGFLINIATNASLITKYKAKELSLLYPSLVRVSLYGGGREAYSKITGNPDLFIKTIRGLDFLIHHKVVTEVMIPVFNFYTMDDLLVMGKICSSLGVGYDFSFAFYPRLNRDLKPLEYLVSQAQLEKFLTKIPKCRGFFSGCDTKKINKQQVICLSARNTIFLSPDGKVGNCFMVMAQSRIPRKSFMKQFLRVWRNDPLLQRHRESRWGERIQCLGCDRLYQRYCIVRYCPGVALLLTGELTGIHSYICEISARICNAISKINVTEKQITDVEPPCTNTIS